VSPPPATARIQFRAWTDDDLPLVASLFGDARVTAFVGGPFDDQWARAWLDGSLASQRSHGVAYWPLFVDGENAGCAGLKPRGELRAGRPASAPDKPVRGAVVAVIELGFYLRPAFWGQGIASEAAAAARDHAFGALGLAWLFAGHHPQNFGSQRTLEKAGFRYTHDEHYPPTGLMHKCYRLDRP
jgi:RimJ/RimL family protein N-acetyltransferase